MTSKREQGVKEVGQDREKEETRDEIEDELLSSRRTLIRKQTIKY